MGAGIEALNCMNCKGIILKNILQTKKENTNESSGSETLKDEFYNGLKDFNGENTKKPIIDSLKSINLLNEKPKAPYFLDQPDFFNLLSSIEESPPINDDKFKIEKITNFIIDNKKTDYSGKNSEKNWNCIDRYNDSSLFISINKNFGDSIDKSNLNNFFSDNSEIKNLDNEQLNNISKNLISTSKSIKVNKNSVFDFEIYNKLANIRKNRKYYFRCLEEYFLDKSTSNSQISTKRVTTNLSTNFKKIYIKKKMNDTFSVNCSTSSISKTNNKSSSKYYIYSKTSLNDDEEKTDKSNNNKLLCHTDNKIQKNYLNKEIYSNFRKINTQQKNKRDIDLKNEGVF